MKSTVVLLAACAMAIAGCSIGRPMLEPTTYLVDVPSGNANSGARFNESVRIGNVRVDAPFGKETLVYRLGDVRYIADPYNAFAAVPREILGSQIAEWLQHSGAFSSVTPPGSARPSAYVLEVIASKLYGDFRSGRPAAAVLTIDFALIDQRGPRPQVVYERSMEQKVELTSASAEELVRGYGIALTNALSQLIADLGELSVSKNREVKK